MRVILEDREYSFLEFWGSTQLHAQQLSEEWLADTRHFIRQWRNEEDHFIAYTSGSSGASKSIEMKKGHARARAVRTIDYFQLQKNQKAMLCLPCSFIAGKMMWVRAFEAELSLILVEPQSNPLKNLNGSIDFIAMTPHQLYSTLEENPEKLALISKILLGGGPVNSALKKRIEGLKSEVYLGYGMTETITHIALKRLNGGNENTHYQTVDGVKLSMNNENRLIINAPHLGLKNLLTTDVVKLIDEHSFTWLGRYDRIINSGGIKVNPEQLEEELSSIISEPYFIYGVADEILGERITLFIEGSLKARTEDEAIRAQIKETNKLIKSIYYINSFRKTHTGKIDRNRTVQSFQNILKENKN